MNNVWVRPRRARARVRGALCCAAAVAFAISAQPAQATEGGASVYLLGTGGPEAAMMPPLTGVFFDNTLYYYDGDAGGGRQFIIGGNVVADLNATIIADFATVLWVPTTNLGGGTLAVGAALPFGEPDVDVSAVLTGPLGNTFGVSRSDSAFVVGDPILTAALGWKRGDFHWQASTMINVPVGDYREGELANLAFHRWAGDFSLAGTWHDDESGWDISSKAGFTFNGENHTTHYDSGTEFHIEAVVEKRLSPAWALGAQAYYFDQVTGDHGSGAVLGSFSGRVTGAGLTASYGFHVGQAPVTLRLRALTEFDARNRLEGDSGWVELSLPLHVNMPPGAPH